MSRLARPSFSAFVLSTLLLLAGTAAVFPGSARAAPICRANHGYPFQGPATQ